MPRLFVALDLPVEIKTSLEPLAFGLGEARWTMPDQQHLTLRFIGDIDNGEANQVAEALSLVPGLPFELQLKGIGHFPPRGEPKVIWAGVAKSRELKDLKKRIDRALKQARLAPDQQKYTPHVTLARLRRPPTQAGLATYLMQHSLFQSQPFTISSFHLYSSWLKPEGPDYQLEASYQLVPGAEDEDWGL